MSVSNDPASVPNPPPGALEDSSPGMSDIEAGQQEKDATVLQPPNPRGHIPKWKWTLTLVAIYLGALLYGLDTTIAADVQASVYESLGEIQNLQWVGLGFPMASVAIILFVGRLYESFNMKWLLTASLAIFEIGSAVCGAAPTSNALIVGRVIAGMGGSGMYLGALNYISVYSTTKEATIYNALIGLSWGTGAILGPVIGGAFSVSSASWRWAFYINLPLAAILSPIYVFIFPSYNPRKELTNLQKLRRIDFIGSILTAAAFSLFMVVLAFGGSTFAWNSGPTIALWVVWGVCVITLIPQQVFTIFTTFEDRVFPVHLLKNYQILLLYIATSSAAAASGITIYYVPLFFQFTRGDSALQAAVRLLPYIILFIFCVMLAGGSLPVVQRYNIYYIVGGMLAVAGGALLFTISPTTSPGSIYGYEALVAIGTGLVFQNSYAIAAAIVPKRDHGGAIGLLNVAQIGSTALSLAIAGTLFQNLGFNTLKDGFAAAGIALPDDYIRSALAGSISPIFQSGNAVAIEIAIAAVSSTIRRVFGTVLAGGALLLVSGLLMPWSKIDFAAALEE